MKKFNKNIKFITYLVSIGTTLFLLVQRAMAQEMNNGMDDFRGAGAYYGPANLPSDGAGMVFFRLSKLLIPIIFIIGIIYFIKRWRRNKKKLNAQKNSQSGKI